MKISIMQTILSSKKRGGYENSQLSIFITKEHLLKLVNSTEENEEIAFRRKITYFDGKLKNPQQLYNED